MKILRYLIFLIFNLAYKDGNYKENDMPYFGATIGIMVYEGLVFILATFFLGRYISFPLIDNILKSMDHVVYGHGMLIFALMYPINHYYFIKKNTLDRIYDEFKNDQINTKKNRIIGYICLVVIWIIMAVLIGHLKYLFP